MLNVFFLIVSFVKKLNKVIDCEEDPFKPLKKVEVAIDNDNNAKKKVGHKLSKQGGR